MRLSRKCGWGRLLLAVLLGLVFFYVGLCIVTIMLEQPSSEKKREKLIRTLDNEYFVISLTESTREFLQYIENQFPENENVCLLPSRIGASGAIRCRSRRYADGRRIYIFYTFNKTVERDQQKFVVFGVFENQMYFSKFTDPVWQNLPAQEQEYKVKRHIPPPSSKKAAEVVP